MEEALGTRGIDAQPVHHLGPVQVAAAYHPASAMAPVNAEYTCAVSTGGWHVRSSQLTYTGLRLAHYQVDSESKSEERKMPVMESPSTRFMA